MGFFCLLWVPLAYVLRRVLAIGNGTGGIWALIFGSVAVIIQFFAGPLVDPGAFGFYRWLSGFVDIVSIPVLAPLVLYLLFVEMQVISPKTDYIGFTLLWLVPMSAFRVTTWISPPSLVMLVLVPVLWTALAVGIPALFVCARKRRDWYSMAPFVLCMAILPFSAATSWWAFFSHRPLTGLLFLLVSVAPALVALVSAFVVIVKARSQGLESGADAVEPKDEDESETGDYGLGEAP